MLGLIIAAPGLLPNLWGLLQSDRLSATRRIPLIYSCKYCTRFLPALLCHDGENYLYVAVSAVSLIAAFTMFVLGVKKILARGLQSAYFDLFLHDPCSRLPV